MAHKQNYLVIIFFLFLFTGCSNQKQQQKLSRKAAVAEAVDTLSVNYKQAVNLTTLNDAYTSSITQTFIVKRKKITVLTGKRGLKVTVNPAALETIDGSKVDGDIVVKMVELTTSEDLFKSNAATMSNGKFLVSGGSYFVAMECKGKQLKVKGKHSIKMEFPKIKENEMELFYGDKDEAGNINWAKANQALTTPVIDNKVQKASYNPPYPDNESRKRFKSRFRLYTHLNDKVYYQKKLMTIGEMATMLHKNGADKNIDTLLIPNYEFYHGLSYDPKYKYDTIRRYRIVSCNELAADADSVAKEKLITAQRDEANKAYNETYWATNDDASIEGRLQRYYAPSSVTRLGWINCDRFYNSPQNADVPIEMPYTFKDVDVQYYLIYKAFNGLMSGKLVKNGAGQYVLPKLPGGQLVQLVAFTKNNGQLFHFEEEFVIQPGEKIKPAFKVISEEQMEKIFGTNVKI